MLFSILNIFNFHISTCRSVCVQSYEWLLFCSSFSAFLVCCLDILRMILKWYLLPHYYYYYYYYCYATRQIGGNSSLSLLPFPTAIFGGHLWSFPEIWRNPHGLQAVIYIRRNLWSVVCRVVYSSRIIFYAPHVTRKQFMVTCVTDIRFVEQVGAWRVSQWLFCKCLSDS